MIDMDCIVGQFKRDGEEIIVSFDGDIVKIGILWNIDGDLLITKEVFIGGLKEVTKLIAILSRISSFIKENPNRMSKYDQKDSLKKCQYIMEKIRNISKNNQSGKIDEEKK